MAKIKKWIQQAIKKPGALHKMLGIAEDKSIPVFKLKEVAKQSGIFGKRARLALTLKNIKKS